MKRVLLPEIGLLESLAQLLYPPVQSEDLDVRHPSTLHHVRQVERSRDFPEVHDSEAGRAIPMKLIATSGRFLGTGTKIIKLAVILLLPLLQVSSLWHEKLDTIHAHVLVPRRAEYDVAMRIAARTACPAYAKLVGAAAIDSGLPPRIVAAVVFVESSCNPTAVSTEGAIGLMQVSPKLYKQNRNKLRDPEYNLRLGTKILAGYVHTYGLQEGLHHYNGLGEGGEAYSPRVLAVAYRR